jgi:hypothetical protein
MIYATVPLGESSYAAMRMREDGTSPVTYSNAIWMGITGPASCTGVAACTSWPAEYVLRVEGPGVSIGTFPGTLKSFSVAANADAATLGTLPPNKYFGTPYPSFGSKALLSASSFAAPYGWDLYYFDAASPNSLALVGASTGGTTPPAVLNVQGLWWNAPAGSESGWGINFAHQGDVVFASWFTYDMTGKGWWLVMTANNTGVNTFSGMLFEATGPAFDAVPFPPQGSPGGITASSVGTGTLTFTDANNGTFAYTVKGIPQTKAITRQVFGALPTCVFSAQNNLTAAANYQDLWWAAPASSESGWGINFTHQGDTIFASWFTFDHDHTPMWLVVTANKSAPGIYTGPLFRTTGGPPFNTVPFPPIGSPGGALFRQVGTATITFSNGNNATFAYTVDSASQTKAITRQVFRPPGTVCQ